MAGQAPVAPCRQRKGGKAHSRLTEESSRTLGTTRPRPGSTRPDVSNKQPRSAPLQPCFHGPLGALRLFSSTCDAEAFILSFQRAAPRPGPGLPCTQEAWGLSPAAPGGPTYVPTQARPRSRGLAAPGREAAGPPRTRVSFASSLTKPTGGSHGLHPAEWGSSGKTQAWGWQGGGRPKSLLTPASASPTFPSCSNPSWGQCAHTPPAPWHFFPGCRRQRGCSLGDVMSRLLSKASLMAQVNGR